MVNDSSSVSKISATSIKKTKPHNWPQSSSIAWEFFKPYSPTHVKCKYCGKLMKNCGSTTSFINHAKTQHSVHYYNVEKQYQVTELKNDCEILPISISTKVSTKATEPESTQIDGDQNSDNYATNSGKFDIFCNIYLVHFYQIQVVPSFHFIFLFLS